MAIPSNVSRWRPQIDKWCVIIGVPQSLVMAMIQMESGGNDKATRYEPGYFSSYVAGNPKWIKFSAETGIPLKSIATSYGLMQMMFATAHGYGCKSVEQALDPSQAIRFGTAHLKTLLDKYPIPEALAAYNGGIGAVDHMRTGKDTPATRYAKNVMALYERYKADISGATAPTTAPPTATPSSAYFKKEEFTCKCGCGSNKTVSKLVSTLDIIRASIGAPVIIISGTRCQAHNDRQKGSVKNSSHITGEAADFQVKGFNAKQLIERVYSLYKQGRLPYLKYCYCPGQNTVHVDVDAKKTRSRVFKLPS